MPFLFFFLYKLVLFQSVGSWQFSFFLTLVTSSVEATSQVIFDIFGCYSSREETHGKRESRGPALEQLLGCAG